MTPRRPPTLTKRVYRTAAGWRLDVTSEWARLYSPTDPIGLGLTPLGAVQLLLMVDGPEYGKWEQDPDG